MTSSFPGPATDSDVIDFSFVDRASDVSDLPYFKEHFSGEVAYFQASIVLIVCPKSKRKPTAINYY